MRDVLEPSKWKFMYATTDAAGKAEGYAFCDTVGKLNILANGIEERIARGARVSE
jgi:hypothetical protein